MSKPVVTLDGQIQCRHEGVGVITPPGEIKLTVNGRNCFTKVEGTVTIGTCTQKKTPSSPANVPCSTFSIDGTATKLHVGGVPVVLEGDSGTSDGLPFKGCLVRKAGQSIFTTN